MATSAGGPEPDAQGAMAGLARELEALGAVVKRLSGLPERIDELSGLVAQLADELAAHPSPPRAHGPASWLALPAEARAAVTLGDLAGWMARVFLRYPDAVQQLPECWLWHPDLVEELLWLRQAWAIAYHPETGAPALAGDWHDRYRPGVVRRIRDRAGTCSIERHRDDPGEPPLVPLTDALDLIARWWDEDRSGSAPTPTEEHLASAARSRRWGGRR